MKLYAYHPVYKKWLPFVTTRIKKANKWIRITGTEYAPKHKGLTWTPPSTGQKVKQIPVDFGTGRCGGHAIKSNRTMKQTASRNKGDGKDYVVVQWKGKKGLYEAILVHCIPIYPNSKTIKPGEHICHIDPKTKPVHTHCSFTRNGKSIHYTYIIF